MAPIIPFPNEIPSESAENNSNEVPPLFLSSSNSYSDSEDDEDHDGYELLSQDPENCLDNHSDDMEEDSSIAEEEKITIRVSSTFLNVGLDEETVSSSESDTEEEIKEIKMDKDHIETIKSVMSTITLPPFKYPEWAFKVPEEEWKSNFLSSKLQQKSGDASPSYGFLATDMEDNIAR